jgi:RES domain-containing protein
VNAWRICFAQHAASGRDAFSGVGSRLHGGRWNSKGVTIAYASATLSLASLEFLVHADVKLLSAAKLVACMATWPDDLRSEIAPDDVYIPGWRDYPAPGSLAEFGDRWVSEQRTAVLFVRSVLIPAELNVLINPFHPDAPRMTYAPPEAYRFDPRLL